MRIIYKDYDEGITLLTEETTVNIYEPPCTIDVDVIPRIGEYVTIGCMYIVKSINYCKDYPEGIYIRLEKINKDNLSV